ncbi:MobF family relaxase [Williamsia muralis]|uniref:MobF family relaxase n=1 Tax=Williamsia marianensis TaxID=85044 RepID=UPI000ACC7D03|nr:MULTISPECIES: MobF family relaxase [Williamsia]PVY27154.1 conjugative relaxase-like TrwC/TraI family protein [Williamsia marianensis]
MSMHKLTAGTGYEYLTRQVAAMDATDKGHVSLADYYSAKGESPGRWLGSGLTGLSTCGAGRTLEHTAAWSVEADSVVSTEQMKALFGEGRHPNADEIEKAYIKAGSSAKVATEASKLGALFPIYTKEPEFRVELAKRFSDYNIERGERWNTPIPDEVRAQFRTTLAREMFSAEHGRDPADDRELSGYLARISRPKQSGVAGYDLTFSPVKSVSTLWAIAPREVMEKVEQAHQRAVNDAVDFIENHALFSRLGTKGVQQVDCHGLIAAAFTHRDSRAGDPDLHTHVTVSNKVQVTGADGITRWMAIDGRPLHKAIVSASERYNTRLEAHLSDLLGVSFAEVEPADRGKRPVREIVGINTGLMTSWSSRRTAIEEMIGELSTTFQSDHGREPTSTEAFDLAQRATLATRDRKHEPRSHAEQRTAWRREAIRILGSDSALSTMVERALSGTAAVRNDPLTPGEIDRCAEHIVGVVAEKRATWQPPHLRAEAERLLRAGIPDLAAASGAGKPVMKLGAPLTVGLLDEAVEQIVTAATGERHSISLASTRLDGEMNEPDMLRRNRSHGRASVYTTHDTELFTSEAIVAAEQRIVAAARQRDGRTIEGVDVDLALLEQTANGRSLNTGQAALVRELATSGRRVQVALAPAGTGKTTAMRVLASAWKASGGTVVGMAPTAAAAAVLRDELQTPTDTLAKLVSLARDEQWLTDQEQLAATPRWRRLLDKDLNRRADAAQQGLREGTIRPATRPDWYRSIGPDTLLVVDEAGMAGTPDLDVAIAHVLSRGGSVRLVGDDQQLASISAGGVLRDVALQTGAVTLTEVVRFSDPAEGSASLALRDGERAALGYYADHHRIHTAADAAAADQAYTAWSADRDSGRESVMLAPTRETVNELNARARADRLAASSGTPVGPIADLADGLQASAGDTICTRRNKRNLRLSATDWVRNGDRWTVLEVSATGQIRAKHHTLGREIVLPADYVRDNVTLGYASTIHAAQGMTADTCHVIGSDGLSRQLLYVAMTRGRHSNDIYLSTAEADPHKVTTPKALNPQTAIELLGGVLDRDGAQTSATTSAREALDPAQRLGFAAAAYLDAVGSAAENYAGPETMATIDAAANTVYDGLTDEPAWPVLRKHLAIIAAHGRDPVTALKNAAAHRELDTADDVAAVLDWRLDTSGSHSGGVGPLSWLTGIPAALAKHHTWGPYLSGRAQRVTELADGVREHAHTWTLTDAPAWARPYVAAAADGELVADLAVFRHANDVPDTDRRPAGPAPFAHAPARAHKNLTRRAETVVTASTDERWTTLATSVDRHLTRDPYWPELAQHLSLAARAGLDVRALVTDAAAQGPLPTETPAAALWWRLSGVLAPATLDATNTAGLRPDWINDVAAVLGEHTASIVISDPAWPGLVTAINAADPRTWTPRDLLSTADELLHAGGEGTHVRADEYARLLTWRVDLLTAHNAAAYGHIPLPEEGLDPEAEEAAVVAAGLVEDDQYPDPALDDYADAPAPDEHVDPPVDADYLAALLEDGAPPEPGYEPEEEPPYRDLPFEDHLPTAPRPPAGGDTRSAAELLADHLELTHQLRELSQQIDTLRAEVLDITQMGEHERAAGPLVADMRARFDAQRPAVLAADRVHARWAELEEDAEEAGRAYTDIADKLAAAQRDNDEAAIAQLEPLERTMGLWRDSASALADSVFDDLVTARTAVDDIAATTGGLVTDTDIERVRMAAQQLDIDTLNETRARHLSIEGRLFRIEGMLAQRHGIERWSLRNADIMADLLASAVPQPAVEPEPPHIVHPAAATADELVEFIQAEPVRSLSDKQLAAAVRNIGKRLARTDNDFLGWKPDTGAEQRVRAAHQQLDTAAEHIQVARQHQAAAHTTHQQVTHLHQQVTALSGTLATVRRRDRPQLQAELDTANQALFAARRDHTAAQALAHQAAVATGRPASEWDTVLSAAADTTAKEVELAAARDRDTRNTDTYRQALAQRDTDRAKLDAALAEQARRDSLEPDARAAENTARDAGESVSKTSARTPAERTTTVPAHAQPDPTLSPDATPQPGPDIGL